MTHTHWYRLSITLKTKYYTKKSKSQIFFKNYLHHNVYREKWKADSNFIQDCVHYLYLSQRYKEASKPSLLQDVLGKWLEKM